MPLPLVAHAPTPDPYWREVYQQPGSWCVRHKQVSAIPDEVQIQLAPIDGGRQMCHDWWMRRQRRREERFDQELRYLLDEERRDFEPAGPVVEHERTESERTEAEEVSLRL